MTLAQTNDGARQASVQLVTGTSLGYNGDWLALFDQAGIGPGDFNGRMTSWVAGDLSAAQADIDGALAALALANGAQSFSQLGAFSAGGAAANAILMEDGTGILMEDGTPILLETGGHAPQGALGPQGADNVFVLPIRTTAAPSMMSRMASFLGLSNAA